MNGVILDAQSLGRGIDLGPILTQLTAWSTYPATQEKDLLDRVEHADVVLTNKGDVIARGPSSCQTPQAH